jgi:hypothetical protein
MTHTTTIPGYITLTEAEERYGIKADTLKKRCQKGEVIGAKKVGKTWLVPNIPGIDPEKTIPENYPNLSFDAALASNVSLYDAESEARSELYEKHKQSVFIWEYGFYFFSLIFNHTHLHRSYMPLAALVTEAHAALRGAFLLNLDGYHSNALAQLRISHECAIKALATRISPEKFWTIASENGNQKLEHKIGVDFSSLWNLESSFIHSNKLKIFSAGKEAVEQEVVVSVSYGPQIDHKLFRTAMNTSIFWLYVLTKSLPYLFPGQVNEKWLKQQAESSKLLRDYIISTKSSSVALSSFDSALSKLIPRDEDKKKAT